MDYLADVKTMLMLDDDSRDSLLKVIIQNTQRALQLRIGSEEVPEELGYIVTEVSIKRFNRIRNEGMTSYSQQGESITFNSNDFDDFKEDIEAWLRNKGKELKSLGTVYLLNPFAGDKE